MEIRISRLREIIAEEMINRAVNEAAPEDKTLDDLLDDLMDAVQLLDHDPINRDLIRGVLDGLRRFEDEKGEEYASILDDLEGAINSTSDDSIGLFEPIETNLQKYRLTSWIDEYVVAQPESENEEKWRALGAKMFTKERWTRETFYRLSLLKKDIQRGKDYTNLTQDDKDLLADSDPGALAKKDPNPFPMTEQRLAEVIREVIADFKK